MESLTISETKNGNTRSRRTKAQAKEARLRILKEICKKPFISQYEAEARLPETNWGSLRRDVESLCEEGILRIERGKRNRKEFYLTFIGLVYCLKNDVIKPSGCRSVRNQHGILLSPMEGHPLFPFSSGLSELTDDVIETEENHPELFYKILGQLENVKEATTSFAVFQTGIFTYLCTLDPEDVEQSQYVIKNFGMIRENFSLFYSYAQRLRVEWLRKLLCEKLEMIMDRIDTLYPRGDDPTMLRSK